MLGGESKVASVIELWVLINWSGEQWVIAIGWEEVVLLGILVEM